MHDSLSASYLVTPLHSGLSAAPLHPPSSSELCSNPLLYCSSVFFMVGLVSKAVISSLRTGSPSTLSFFRHVVSA